MVREKNWYIYHESYSSRKLEICVQNLEMSSNVQNQKESGQLKKNILIYIPREGTENTILDHNFGAILK